MIFTQCAVVKAGRHVVTQTRLKVLKVAKIKDAKYGCEDEGNDDGKHDRKVDDNGLMMLDDA